MVKLKNVQWWSAFWASVSSPTGPEIFAKATFKVCHAHNMGLTVMFTVDDGPILSEVIPHQPAVDFDKLCAQLSSHKRKPMSFINDLDVII